MYSDVLQDKVQEPVKEVKMDIFRCKGCGFEYDADIAPGASDKHNCPECRTENGPQQNRNGLWGK